MFIVTGIIKFESEQELARVRDTLIGRAERSRKDAGCIAYTFSVSLEDSSEIRLTEKWASEALLQKHLQIPDDEFNSVIGTAKIKSAIVVSNEVTAEKELLNR